MAHLITHLGAVSLREAWAFGLAAACIASCGTSSTGADQPGPDAQGADAGAIGEVDTGAPADAPSDAADEKREASPPIAPLDLVPDSPLVYQSANEISLPDAEQGKLYFQEIRVRAGTGVAPYHLSFSGLLPTAFGAVVEHDNTTNPAVAVLGVPADLGVIRLRVDLVDPPGANLSPPFPLPLVHHLAT